MKKRLGELLLEKRLIDVDQLTAALAHQRQWGIRLGAALVANGFIAEGSLMQVLSDTLGLPMVDLSKVVVDKAALALVPVRVCEQYEIFPIAVRDPKGGRRLLLLAMADPLNVTAIDEVAFLSDCIVKPGIAQASSIDQAIQRHYRGARVEIAAMNFARPAPRSPSQTALQGVGAAPVVGRALPQSDFIDEITDAPAMASTTTRPPSASWPTPKTSPPLAPPTPMAPPRPASSPPSPLMAQATDPFATVQMEDYAGMPTGVFAMPASSPPPVTPPTTTPQQAPQPSTDREAFEALERKFWALMRVLHRRGQITREEFVAELGEEL